MSLLTAYGALLTERARAGFWGETLNVEVSRREYLQLMYETHQYRGVAASGETLMWAPWPTDPDQNLPTAVEIRLPGGRITFRPSLPYTSGTPSKEN